MSTAAGGAGSTFGSFDAGLVKPDLAGVVVARAARGDPLRTSAKPTVVAMLVVLVVGGVFFGYVRFREGKVDGLCDDAFGCVDDAVCVGRLPGLTGFCYATCDDTSPCGDGHECRSVKGRKLCVPVAPVGGECGGNVQCPHLATCIGGPKVEARCREACDNGKCPEGLVCRAVLDASDPGSLYCVPP
jgi:hypothetical protein